MKKRIICFALIFALLMPVTYASAEPSPLRGVWVGSVANLDFPSDKGLSKTELCREIDSIISECKKQKLNAIFFQVRPNSDALYASDIFPWSEVLSGTQGIAPDSDFDPLEYIIKKAHAQNIELHAWINPYRIGDLSKTSENNPAKLHPEYVVNCSDGKAYYNPALPEVRELVTDGVLEIVKNYDVDGIHFDDYFYPYDVEDFPDSADFAKYGKGFDNIADFRRNNVNLLVKNVSEAIRKQDKSVKFGISPFGIWDNKRDNPLGSDTKGLSSYAEIFADSRYWVKQNLVDYICPQIYWSFENTAAPFATLVDWWSDLCKNSKTELYIGIGQYKLGTNEAGWQDAQQVTKQIAYCDKKSAVDGTVIFRYSTLVDPPEIKKPVTTPGQTSGPSTSAKPSAPSSPPVTSKTVKVTGPAQNFKTEAAYCSFTGMADPSKPLSVNGTAVTMTQNGYFAIRLPLRLGNNTFKFINGTSSDSITVRRVSPPKPANALPITSVFPQGDCAFFAGEKLTLSVRADKNSEVFAQIDGEKIKMTAQTDGVTYKTDFSLPNTLSADPAPITIEFMSVKNGTQYSYPTKTTLRILTSARTMYTATECYTYESHLGGSMMDNYQYPVGACVSVTAETVDMYRLSTGKWMYKTDLSESAPEPATDIDKQKYLCLPMKFDSPFSYQCDMSDSGVLIIDFYHRAGDTPKFKTTNKIKITTIKNKTHTRLLVSFPSKPVTGFYADLSKQDTFELCLYSNPEKGISGKVIVLDPGHGGDDPGAYGPPGAQGKTESDLNLDMAKLLKSALEQKGAKVYLTRTDDSTLLLKDRAALIRSYSPDLCISVHHNSTSRDADFNAATGLLTLYSRHTAYPLARSLSASISKNTGLANLGAKTQSLNVCRDYRYPCVLLECGYVCNPKEYEKLLSDSYKTALCNNIVGSIVDYLNKNC